VAQVFCRDLSSDCTWWSLARSSLVRRLSSSSACDKNRCRLLVSGKLWSPEDRRHNAAVKNSKAKAAIVKANARQEPANSGGSEVGIRYPGLLFSEYCIQNPAPFRMPLVLLEVLR
jgi:hypothetical protein